MHVYLVQSPHQRAACRSHRDKAGWKAAQRTQTTTTPASMMRIGGLTAKPVQMPTQHMRESHQALYSAPLHSSCHESSHVSAVPVGASRAQLCAQSGVCRRCSKAAAAAARSARRSASCPGPAGQHGARFVDLSSACRQSTAVCAEPVNVVPTGLGLQINGVGCHCRCFI